jgi:hypothetical protein
MILMATAASALAVMAVAATTARTPVLTYETQDGDRYQQQIPTGPEAAREAPLHELTENAVTTVSETSNQWTPRRWQ